MRKKGFLIVGGVIALLALVFLAGCKAGALKEKGGAGGDTLRPGQAGFKEYPIGEEKQLEGMSINGVYFQAVQMEPKELAGGPDEADIHLEADIRALKNNKFGFGFGEFIPNMSVNYKVKKLDTGEEQQGSMMPMNASDGPHYGANIKMPGAGKYKVTYIITSPEKQGFLLHVDKETGVEGRFWKKPLEVEWEFNYLPLE